MKTNELRIGNYVKCDNLFCKIVNIYSEYIYCYDQFGEDFQNIEYIEPIELTEELLLKLGFRVDCISNNITLYKYESMLLNGKVSMEYFLYTNGNSILDCKFFNNCDFFNNCNSIFKNNIKFLHHLQNSYHLLTNQELEINL